MKCFTLIDDKVEQCIDMTPFRWCHKFKNPVKVETAALEIFLDPVWNTQDILNKIKERSDPDALLYGIAMLSEGDTNSALFPADCFLLSLPITGYVPDLSMEDCSMPVVFSDSQVIRVCFREQTFIKTPNHKYIVNPDGSPAITDTVASFDEPPGGIVWQF